METTAEVRRDIDVTRQRMSATVQELEARIHGKVDAVKEKLDVAGLVRAHPWEALAVAAIAGVALAASGVDRKAAVATGRAAKQAPRVTGRALAATASGAVHLAGSAVSRLSGGPSDGTEPPGFVGRTRSRISDMLRAQARELGDHLGRAAEELVRSSVPRRDTADVSMRMDRY